ncbi:TetR/AcrR family transcriptional regulator [Streptomyces thermocarboxydus]
MDTTQRTEQQRSADRRRRELLEAADRVVLRDGPGASMNAIAAEAGITKPILYRHFGDKEDSTPPSPSATPTPCWTPCGPRWTRPRSGGSGSRPRWTPTWRRSRPGPRSTAS